MRSASTFFIYSTVKLPNLLLVDDIYTTGTTLDAAAQCLKKAGAGEVFFLTIAVGSDPQAGTPD